MDEKNYNDIRKNELNVEAQKIKDKFIDDMLRRFNEFTGDWNSLVGKLASLNQGVEKSDKLNQ